MVRSLFLFLLAYLGTTALTPLVVVLKIMIKLCRKESVSTYLKDCAIGYDQAGGSVLYQQENFTISSFTYFLCYYKRNKSACIFMRLIDFLFGKNHCKHSYLWEVRKDLNDIKGVSNV